MLSKIKFKIQKHKFAIGLALIFLILNSIWVILDQRVPIIGDDPRFIQGGYELAQEIKSGNLSEIWNTWQNMYIHPERFPRTPLFSLVAVPAFLLFGPNEDAAIISNLLIVFFNSLLIYSLCWLLLSKRLAQEWQKVGILAVLFYNCLPGVFGFGRLYISETAQTFLVLLITYQVLKNGASAHIKHHLLLGILIALALLLRFIMPIYLFIPAVIWIAKQIRARHKPSTYLRNLIVLLLAALPLLATWYAKNGIDYWEFTKYTSSGELAGFYSLGPVFSPITIAKFWYVILMWIIGWPFVLVLMAAMILLCWQKLNSLRAIFTKLRTEIAKSWRKENWYRMLTSPWFLLIITPLPALVSTTLSLNKTARYFLPVLPFWIIFAALIFQAAINALTPKKIQFAVMGVALVAVCYPYAQSILGLLPALPRTMFNPATRLYDQTTQTQERYLYFVQLAQEIENISDLVIYNTAEQPRFNDAELIWFASQYGLELKHTDEFSRYTNLEEGKQEAEEADIIILETEPEAGILWIEKYLELNDYVLGRSNFVEISRKTMPDGSIMIILFNIKANYVA